MEPDQEDSTVLTPAALGQFDLDWDEESENEGTVDWAQIDQELFGPEWIREMEALDSMPTSELYHNQSADGFIPTDWFMAHTAMQDALNALGLVGPKLLLQKGDELLLVGQLALHLGLELGQSQVEWHRRSFAEEIRKLERSEPLAKRMRGEHLSPALQHMNDVLIVAGRKPHGTAPGQEPGASIEADWAIPQRGARGRLKSSSGVAAEGLTRDELDRRKQAHWAREVMRILAEVPSPVVVLARETSDPERILSGAVGNTRGSTMESYVKAVKVLLTWWRLSYGTNWPDKMVGVVEFLHVAGQKPCSPSFPGRLLAALSWFEKVGGWAPADRITECDLVMRTVAYWTDELRSGMAPLKQAPRLPWAVMCALELFICNPAYQVKLRLKAWTILLKAWATLREDDAQHICPAKLRQSGELLITELARTKTTGASKRVRQLPVAVWLGCTISRMPWLETGLGLLDEVGPKSRDYILPSFAANGEALQEPMTYQESAALSRQVWSRLKAPVYCVDKHEWEESGMGMICPELISFWTEHSPRSTLPSSAQVLECPKDERNYLGRWSPSGADEYGRAYRIVVQGIQRKVWSAVLSGDPRLREDDVVDRLDQWCEARELGSGKLGELKLVMLELIDAFWKEIAQTGGPPEPDEVVPLIPVPAQEFAEVATRNTRKGKFLIVYTRNRKHAKLHRVGGCAWTSVTLADCQEVIKVSNTMYNSRCKLCWPEMAKKVAGEVSDCSSASEL